MKHKTLAELQTALQDFLLDKKVDTDALTLETPEFSKQERLGIYHDAYRLRLIDALRHDYPALEQALGEEKFADLTNEFIAKHPSQHPSLRWLGQKLPDFLRTNSNQKKDITITELAEFEWAQAMAFDAADEEVITLEDIRALPPESWMTMKISFHPSLQLLYFFSNVPDQWQALINDKSAITTTISSNSQTWLIWRENLQVVYRPLQTEEAWALNTFIKKQNFADVCNGLCEWFEEEAVPMQAAQYLQGWINSALITSVTTQQNESF